MPSSAAAGYSDLIEGKLIAAVSTGTTTNVTVKVKQINGATPTWPTVAHRLKVTQRTATNNKAEIWQVAAGTTQSGQTVTLGTLTRALSLSDGTSFAGSAGTAQSFSAGADVFLAWDVHDAAMTPKLDITNTFTGTNNFSGAVVTTGSVKVPVYADATARDAAIPSPANGMLVYLTDQGVLYQYIAGAWTTFATGTTSNGSTTVAGKFEEATVAEQGSATATGGTGARLVPANANIIKTSAGSADENKLAVMNSAGVLDVSAGGTGVRNPTSGSLYVGAGSSAMTAVAPSTSGNVLTSNGSTWTSSSPGTSKIYSNSADLTILGSDTSEQTVIPATAIASSFWSVGKSLIIDGFHQIKSAAAPTLTLKLKLGSTAVLTYAFVPAAADTQINFRAIIVCRATGSGGSFNTTLVTNNTTTMVYNPTDQAGTPSTEVAVDVSSSVNFSMTAQFNASSANNLFRTRNIVVYSM